jgi:hypothetical protein
MFRKPKYEVIAERQDAVDRMAAKLTRQYWPRMTMLLVVSIAAGVSFLSSAVMLWIGLRYMPLRYALACMVGYGAFLVLMNQWLGRRLKQSLVEDALDVDNALDISGAVLRSGSRAASRAADTLFQGGRSGGGGASASFDTAMPPPPVQPAPMFLGSSTNSSGSSKGFSLDLDDADDLLPVMAIAAIVIGIGACASVIWQAPNMLAELLVDGAVVGTAYRGMRSSIGDWTAGILRRTIVPALIITVTFILLGVAGHQLQPGADSIGDFFR